MQQLQCIVYVSSAVSELSDPQLEALLLDAREFNEQAGVTGVLLYNGGAFFQYFEGPPASVAEVYERIRKSRKHHSIYELLSMPQEGRLFPRWYMGLSQASPSAMLALQSAEWRRVASMLDGAYEVRSPGLALLQEYWRDNSNSL